MASSMLRIHFSASVSLDALSLMTLESTLTKTLYAMTIAIYNSPCPELFRDVSYCSQVNYEYIAT